MLFLVVQSFRWSKWWDIGGKGVDGTFYSPSFSSLVTPLPPFSSAGLGIAGYGAQIIQLGKHSRESWMSRLMLTCLQY